MIGEGSFPGPVEVIEGVLAGEAPDVPDGYSANALLLGPSGEPGEGHVCGELLSLFGEVNVLGVAIQHDRSYYERVWSERFEDAPARLGVVEVGAEGSVAAGNVRTVATPGDLTGIGITVTDFIKRWADAEEPTVVCFDSLTPLLQYTEQERVYRFLDVTTRRLSQVCAVSHAHINPLAHDERTLQQLMGVFDAVVEPGDGSGSPADWTVRRA
jgi:hypothetical protein